MLRILGILVPALLGAALVWFLIPATSGPHGGAETAAETVPNAATAEKTGDADGFWSAVGQNMSDQDKEKLSLAVGTLFGDPEELFGQRLKIATPDNQLTVEDFDGADAKFLNRAFQECQIVMTPDLRQAYLESIGKTAKEAAAYEPDEAQTATCVAVMYFLTERMQAPSQG